MIAVFEVADWGITVTAILMLVSMLQERRETPERVLGTTGLRG